MALTKLNIAIPVLLTLDVNETVKFYTETLSFKCRHKQIGFAILVRDAIELHFTQCPEKKLVEWSCCRINASGIDALFSEFSKCKVIHPNCTLHQTDYGTREFGILDSQGVLITFFEPIAVAK